MRFTAETVTGIILWNVIINVLCYKLCAILYSCNRATFVNALLPTLVETEKRYFKNAKIWITMVEVQQHEEFYFFNVIWYENFFFSELLKGWHLEAYLVH